MYCYNSNQPQIIIVKHNTAINMNQIEIYKLVESLTDGNFKNEIELLKTLVKKIVKLNEFGIIGGRVWELVPEDYSYSLRFQFGKVKKIPADYTISLKDNTMFENLYETRTIVNYETDDVLKEKGIVLYSAAGVGDLVKIKGKKYYQYVVGFNANEFLQIFYDTLNIISGVATVAVKNLASQFEQRKIYRDMLKAAEIQKNLLPEHKIQFHDYDIYGVCIPDSSVGGDYFDYIQNVDEEEERLGIVISDAASKGLPAAIQSLFVSGALRMATSFGTKISGLMAKLNTLIWRTFFYERFVTLFYCELQLSSNRLVLYANAGHPAPIHYRPSLDSIVLLEPTGGILGLAEHQKFNVENIRMHNGDVLVLYTDGITECQDKFGNRFEEERLYDIIRKYHYETSQNIALHIIEEVEKFAIDSNYTDDKTLVVIKREGEEIE
jgi:serine phosphatase RsbU (regulator of sigma subunit)